MMKRLLDEKVENESVMKKLLSSCKTKNIGKETNLQEKGNQTSNIVGSDVVMIHDNSFDDQSEVTADTALMQQQDIGLSTSSCLKQQDNDSNTNNDSSPKQQQKSQIDIDDEYSVNTTHPELPPGWKVRLSRSKNRPYYVHPDHGATWYFPGRSGWREMYSKTKGRSYFVHPDHGSTWFRPMGFTNCAYDRQSKFSCEGTDETVEIQSENNIDSQPGSGESEKSTRTTETKLNTKDISKCTQATNDFEKEVRTHSSIVEDLHTTKNDLTDKNVGSMGCEPTNVEKNVTTQTPSLHHMNIEENDCTEAVATYGHANSTNTKVVASFDQATDVFDEVKDSSNAMQETHPSTVETSSKNMKTPCDPMKNLNDEENNVERFEFAEGPSFDCAVEESESDVRSPSEADVDEQEEPQMEQSKVLLVAARDSNEDPPSELNNSYHTHIHHALGVRNVNSALIPASHRGALNQNSNFRTIQLKIREPSSRVLARAQNLCSLQGLNV